MLFRVARFCVVRYQSVTTVDDSAAFVLNRSLDVNRGLPEPRGVRAHVQSPHLWGAASSLHADGSTRLNEYAHPATD